MGLVDAHPVRGGELPQPFIHVYPTITTCSHHHYRSPSVPPSNLNANVTSSEMASRSFSGKQTECCPPGCKFWEGGGLLWTLAQKTRLTVLLEGEQEGSWKMK